MGCWPGYAGWIGDYLDKSYSIVQNEKPPDGRLCSVVTQRRDLGRQCGTWPQSMWTKFEARVADANTAPLAGRLRAGHLGYRTRCQDAISRADTECARSFGHTSRLSAASRVCLRAAISRTKACRVRDTVSRKVVPCEAAI